MDVLPKQIKILIIDDCKQQRSILTENLGTYNHFDVVGQAADGIDGVDMVKKLAPDVVLLDISMPYCDGLSVLKKINEYAPQTIVIVVTAISNDNVTAEAMRRGASYYVLKPFSYEDLADKITFLSEPPEEPSEKEEMPESLYKVVVQQDYDGANHSEIKEFTDVLRKIGIPPKLKGYWYISEAIRICKQSKEDNIYITKILYPEIAKKFGASRFQVERAMRHSIERTWEKRDIDSLTDIFGDEALCDKRPTNQDFIMKIIAYLGKNKYANSDLVTNKNAWI